MTTPAPLLFSELTRTEISQHASTHIALMPVGATEQHGPHLPVGTDTFAVEEIVHSAATAIHDEIPVIVTPTLAFGSSHHHLQFGGTFSLKTETYYALLTDLVESLITDGFKRVILINGHGGNQELIQLVVRDLALIHPVVLGAASYWTMAQEEITATGALDIARMPGHAGHFETSLMMALKPELVIEPRPARDSDPSLLSPPDLASRLRYERNDSWAAIDGFTDSPASASDFAGEAYFRAAVIGVARAITAFAEAST